MTSGTPQRHGIGDYLSEFPLSAQQEFLWEGMRFRSFGRRIASRNNPFIALELTGDLDVGQLRRALSLMVDRHESLRTTLTDLGSEPYQRVAATMESPFSYVDLAGTVADSEHMPILNSLVAGVQGGEFDLVAGPLWNCLLIKVTPDRHVLALSFSHLIIDGVSLISFVRQLRLCYAGKVLPALKSQYRHFVEESRQAVDRSEAKVEYWRRQLLPLPARLPFPTDYSASPPPLLSFATEDLQSSLTAAQMRAMCRASSATPFMLNVAAYAAVLACTAGVERVVIGSSVARLDLKPDEDMLGYFLDIIFLAVRVDPRDTLGELVGHVRDTVFEAQENILPYLQLAAAVNPDFASQRPWPGIHLYDAWLRGRVFESTPSAASASFGDTTVALFQATGGSSVRRIVDHRHEDAYTRYFLPSLYLNDAGASSGYLEYNTAVFRAQTIRRIVARQQAFVGHMAAPHTRIGDVWNAIR